MKLISLFIYILLFTSFSWAQTAATPVQDPESLTDAEAIAIANERSFPYCESSPGGTEDLRCTTYRFAFQRYCNGRDAVASDQPQEGVQ